MRTLKLIGSGPLAGVSMYATVRHIDLFSDDGFVLELDEPQQIGDRLFGTVTVSVITGALKVGRSESDLITLAEPDRKRLKDIWAGWTGREPTNKAA